MRAGKQMWEGMWSPGKELDGEGGEMTLRKPLRELKNGRLV